MTRSLRPLLVFAASTILWQCSSDGGTEPPPPPVPTSLSLSQSAVELTFLGATAQLNATVRDQNGNAISGASVTWASNNTGAVTVSSTGTVTAVAVGSAQVTATSGNLSGSATVTVTQQPAAAASVQGNAQTGTVGQALAAPLVVQINDGGDNPIPDVAVTFAVTSGGGSVSVENAMTDAGGQASTDWTLGTTAGDQTVTASTNGVSATFTATGTADVADSIAVSSGDGQQAPPSTKLPDPIVAKVVDQYGNGVSGHEVSFTVTAGGGTLDDAMGMTDENGEVGTGWTLGGAEGENTAEASSPGLKGDPVVFTAQATDLTVSGVSPDPMVEGETATIMGSGFSLLPMDNAVTVDGVVAMVLTATPTELTITVPVFECRPLRDVAVDVTVGAVTSDPFTHALGPDAFLSVAVGEQVILDDPSTFCLQFEASAAGGDEYIIGLGAAAEVPASELGFTLTSVAGAPATTGPPFAAAVVPPARPRASATWAGVDLQVLRERIAHAEAESVIREWELQHLDPRRNPALVKPNPIARAARAAMAVGDTLSLRVPDFSGGDPCNDFTDVTAIVKVVGDRGIFATDTLNPAADSLTDADLTAFSDTFDVNIYALDTLYFGSDTDLDGNSGVVHLLTIEINRLPGTGGFVWGGDLLTRAQCGASDEGELVYLGVPDPADESGTGARTKDAVLRRMPSLVAHEFAHVIQTTQRAFAPGGALLTRWESEGQATIAEEVVGHSILGNSQGNEYGSGVAFAAAAVPWYGLAFQQLAMFYGWMPPMTTTKVPNAPEVCTMFGGVSGVTTPCNDFAFYGASWSLQRYLADRFGGGYSGGEVGMFRDWVAKNKSLSGVPNLEALLGVEFDSLFARWGGMLYADGRVATGAELDITSWDMTDVMDAYVTDAFRLIPPERTFEDFMDSRSVRGGSTAYTLLTSTGSRRALAIRVRDALDAVLATTLNPQLWIVRLK